MPIKRSSKRARYNGGMRLLANTAYAVGKHAVVPFVKAAISSRARNAGTQTHKSSSRSVGTQSRGRTARRYRTLGSYKGKTKKLSPYVPSIASKVGSCIDIENGGIAESADCIYIGHLVCSDSLQKMVARSIVRMLFLQIRQCPNSWTEKIRPYDTALAYTVGNVKCFYSVDPDNAMQTFFVGVEQ